MTTINQPQIFRHLWGVEADLKLFLEQLQKQQIYNGIEAGLVWQAKDQQEILRSFLKDSSFHFIAMIFTDLPFRPSYSVKEHVEQFKRQVDEALPFEPMLINVHGGKDSFNEKQREEYFTEVLDYSTKLSLPLVHETHRGRILYNPWVTKDLIEKFPHLRLCADFSHWVTVCERLLTTPEDLELFHLLAARCDHIHARVGQEQAPQVSDPRAPEWASHVKTFESWWDLIIQEKVKLKASLPTFTPEYGPIPYMPTLPSSQQAVSDLKEIIDWSARRLKEKYFSNERINS
jgi:hypothetical protein